MSEQEKIQLFEDQKIRTAWDEDTLKLIPGTPEENAPVFDFENERILRPAA